MANCYHAEIINLSQNDISIFKCFDVIDVRKRFLGIVKIYKINIPEKDIQEIINRIQLNMSRRLRKEWYATFYNSEKAIVVFRKKTFNLSTIGISPVYQHKVDTTNSVDKKHWDEMISYAKSLNIPNNQLDFLPPDFRTEKY